MIGAMKASAAEWAERVRAWRESGQGAAEFAAGKDFTDRTLRWWASEFARRERPSVKMARVVRVAETTDVTIVVGDARIGVRRGFDPELLREVVIALAGAR